MKKFYTLLLIASALSFSTELGLIVGRPTGVSFNHGINHSNSLDFQAGWDFENDYFDLHGSYLFYRKSDIRIERIKLDFYFGPGFRVYYKEDNKPTEKDKDFYLGVKVPFGLKYNFRTVPFSLSAELGPCLLFGEDTTWEPVGGITFRYIFRSSNNKKEPETAPDKPRRR